MITERYKRAFLVLGPESSGTRLVTEMLIVGGCVGNSGHEQAFDDQPFGDHDVVVWRRSEPHFLHRESLDLGAMLERCDGRDVTAVVTTRESIAVASSLVAKGAACDLADGVRRIRDAYTRIFTQLADWGVPFVITTYETFILYPVAAQRALWQLLELPGGHPVAVRDENRKHYGRAIA